LVAVGFIAGLLLLVFFGEGQRWTAVQIAPFVIAAVLAAVPRVRRGVREASGRLNDLARRRPMTLALTVGAAALLAILLPPLVARVPLYPRSHDEQMHMVQAQMLARGRLAMPPHPVGEFFDTFFLIQQPRYASVYFPGTSLLFVPTVWLHLPYALLPAIYSAAAVAMLFRVLSELTDNPSLGLLGAAVLLSSTIFRSFALMAMSHNVMLLLGLICFFGWLRWMNAATALRWALVTGTAAGWAAITRPVDAVCWVVPLILFGLPRLLSLPMSARVRTLGCVIAGAAPFLALQLIFNLQVTGRLLYSPYQLYLDQDQPQTSFGFFPYDPDAWPQSRLVQKHLYYDQYLRPSIQAHRPDRVAHTFVSERLPMLLEVTLPHPLLILLLPVGLPGLCSRRRLALAAVLPLLIAAYTLNPFLLSHYLLIWSPPVILLIVLASAVRIELGLLVLAACVAGQPGIDPHAVWRWPTPLLDDGHDKLAHLPRTPAFVLFRYDPRRSFNEEPVYNSDVAWPDDARVVRAHDLGAENAGIIRYYAEHQPQRVFYRYDNYTGELSELGTAAQLAK
jgi:hypothetical protein